MTSDTARVRRYLRDLFGVFLLLDLVALGLILDAKEGTHLTAAFIDIRNAVFSKFVSQCHLEAHRPNWRSKGF